jgi:23S rRNA (cytidine1920-2'-O)/16S rRNA (cytidine1409-2'-O)-methyltransferase
MTGPRAPAEEGASVYVSRGGAKLDRALDAFGVVVEGIRALDAGASTGGFTDCLLQRGAARVIAVDVAYGQLAWTLRNDERVRVLERTNVRTLDLSSIGESAVDLVVADLAFISLRTVRDALLAAAAPDAELVLLVKPQFEAPRERVEKGGVVRDPDAWREAMTSVADAYREAGCGLVAAAPSPLVGPAGNREFFLHLRRGAPDAQGDPIDLAVRKAP